MRASTLFRSILLILPVLLHSPGTTAQDFIDSVVESNIGPVCAKKPNLPVTVCHEMATAAVNSLMGRDVDVEVQVLHR